MSHTMTSARFKTTMIVGDRSLDVADLDVIKLESLTAKDPDAMANLLMAAELQGFFYVTFNHDLSEKISGYLQTCYLKSHEYFAKPLEEKMKGFREGVNYGYKCAGVESFEVGMSMIVRCMVANYPQIPRDEQNSMTLPSPFAEHAGVMLDLANICDNIAHTCLRSLSDSLGLGEPSDLKNAHLPDGKSDSGIKFVYGPTKASIADVPDTTHTDGGSITLLWCEKWASQMQTKETKQWLWIDPRPNCVLVNVADYLQNQTGGRLHSPIHRVSQPTDGVEDRYFVSYFLRPNH